MNNATPINGITYYLPPAGAGIEGRDGRASIRFEGIPVPLDTSDFKVLDGAGPDYDMVGRGIYTALRVNPDCAFNSVYALWLRDGYPHLFAEMATHILMLDHKDVDVAYLDRKINYLRVMSLLDTENADLASEIGAALLDRGLRMSALQQCTVYLYRAEKYLSLAVEKSPENLPSRLRLAETWYLLGRYEQAAGIWNALPPSMAPDDRERLALRGKRVTQGNIPKIPPVDYLEAIGVALESYQNGEFEECAAILGDVLDDMAFVEDFPMPEVWHHLGLCYQNLAMPRNAEECFEYALKCDPDHVDSRNALTALTGGGR